MNASFLENLRHGDRARLLKGLWLLALAVGALGLFQRLFYGDQAAGFGSYVPWGLWVAAYTYFSGLAAGAFLLAAGIRVFNIRALEPIAKLCLFASFITLALGLITIGLDLGHMERALLVLLRPQFHSMMAWMVWLYTAYLILLVLLLRRSLRPGPAGSDDAGKTPGLMLAGIPLVIGFAGGVGALFGTVAAREYWHSSLFPVFFLAGALTSGAALVTALTAWLWPGRDEAWKEMVQLLGRIVLGLVLLECVLEFAEFTIPAWYGVGSGFELVWYVLFGPYWYVFWIFHLGLGVAVPLYLLARRPEPKDVGLAAALVTVMFFAVRLNLVIPGLIVPELRGLEQAYTDPVGGKLSFAYLPSLFEWQILIGVVAVGVALWLAGTKRFPNVFPSPSQSSEVKS
ncbi:prokaryotic molybdopterin-containing oxidoreductase family, membrane subunit [Humidesulfovibrio mexicanus]|uniref:Prokaryotic molybdopterin-containing oxidoreductase family, membrane subunit n=1 Tax=Humidesulfovibrio mexicanus TaxID=147047 RepID=A0A239CI66_9BACT|nr:NrfD/PsrC family molybdoenzyme membrane anchor subunit [Humidesulfovibrio mexicanus]SNS19639.1 prokaryotic molybdopterin-containing oxidoreductase family, membrane subunit [Humidesulfovibrio mexicanus]